jgi:hypothetical protein
VSKYLDKRRAEGLFFCNPFGENKKNTPKILSLKKQVPMSTTIGTYPKRGKMESNELK